MEEPKIAKYHKSDRTYLDVMKEFDDNRLKGCFLEEITKYSLCRAIHIRNTQKFDTDNREVYDRMALYYLLKPSRLDPVELDFYRRHRDYIIERTEVYLADVY